ncbi:hypothetical protein CCACVL1_17558 [Corchorus capsularis]|uniref:Uncharacterized protein n=1 Tax=Corchorus capsularis TaxID=210143 RepID=A0A1R3HRM0_COCAP|nr:hypothetical protein CCACVL1_17558 [Corchorus capsularis]
MARVAPPGQEGLGVTPEPHAYFHMPPG